MIVKDSQGDCAQFTRAAQPTWTRPSSRVLTLHSRSAACVTRDSRVVSHGLSQCPDPTRPDPYNAEVFIHPQVEGDRLTAAMSRAMNEQQR